MKKLITILLTITLLSSCSAQDFASSHAALEEQLKTSNIYTVDPFNHIVFYTNDSIYHYRTGRFGTIHYKIKIK